MCEQCQSLLSADGPLPIPPPATGADLDPLLVDRDRVIRELELELAQTKLALVESQCKTQDLTHDLNAAMGEIQESKNTWFQKTLTSIKEVRKEINLKGASVMSKDGKKVDGLKEVEMQKM